MASPWEKYQSAAPQPAAQGRPWAKYQGQEMVQTDFGLRPANEVVDVVAKAPPKQSLFRSDSDFRERSGVGATDMLVAAAKDMFGGDPAAYLAGKTKGRAEKGADGRPILRLPDGTAYGLNDAGIDNADVGNVAGNVAAFFLPASWAGRVAQVRNMGLLGRVGMQGGAAALTDAGIQAGVNNGQIDAKRAALVGAGGAGGELAGAGLRVAASRAANAIPQATRELAAKASAMGINLTPAQLSDSAFLKRLALMTDRLPFSGAGKRAAAQQQAGNKKLAGLLGQEADAVDTTVMSDAAEAIGSRFDEAMQGGMQYGRDFLRNVAELKRQAADLDSNALTAANRIADRVKRAGNGGQISGRALLSMDRQARTMASSGNADVAAIGGDFREVLHDAFEKQAPASVKSNWDEARRQWATLKALEPVVARNTEGGVPLQQLQGAINATKRGRTLRSRGKDGELGTLASIGQRIKPPNSSGTAENIQSAGIGAGAISSPLLTLLTLGTGGIASRGLASSALANIMLRESPGTAYKALAKVAPASGALVVSEKKGRDKRNNGK